MIIWYNGNGASNRSEKNSRFRKEFESVGWRENGPIDEIISAYSDIFKYYQYLFRLIRNHTKLFKVIRIDYGYLIPIKGNILKVSYFLLSFPKYRSYSLIIKCDNFKKTRIFCFRSQNFQCVIFKIFCDYFDLKWLCEHLNLAYVYGVYAFSIL